MNVDAFIDLVRKGIEKKKSNSKINPHDVTSKLDTNKENVQNGSNQAGPTIKKPVKISPVKTPEYNTKSGKNYSIQYLDNGETKYVSINNPEVLANIR